MPFLWKTQAQKDYERREHEIEHLLAENKRLRAQLMQLQSESSPQNTDADVCGSGDLTYKGDVLVMWNTKLILPNSPMEIPLDEDNNLCSFTAEGITWFTRAECPLDAEGSFMVQEVEIDLLVKMARPVGSPYSAPAHVILRDRFQNKKLITENERMRALLKENDDGRRNT